MMNDARKNRSRRRRREYRQDHHSRGEHVRALLLHCASPRPLTDLLRGHITVVLAVSPAAHGQHRLYFLRPQQRRCQGKHEETRQRNGKRTPHTLIVVRLLRLGYTRLAVGLRSTRLVFALTSPSSSLSALSSIPPSWLCLLRTLSSAPRGYPPQPPE